MGINEYILTLQQIKGCGPKSQMAILEYIINNQHKPADVGELFDLISYMAGKRLLKRFPHIELSDMLGANAVARRIIDQSESLSIGMINYWDASRYPSILRGTVDEKGKECPPLLLYYKGDLSAINRPGVAVIGTREPTPEGTKAGEYFAEFFASYGFNIVSGLALGCDTCGHKGALKANGVTTAFLAHGLDSIYPPQNEDLAKDIVDNGGLLLSEYPVGANVNAYRLVERDRLQAGLSRATIVVQTGVSGGTNHAATATLVAEKPLYVIEYKQSSLMENPKVAGNQALVAKGGKYLNSKSDLMEIVSLLRNEKKSNVQQSLW